MIRRNNYSTTTNCAYNNILLLLHSNRSINQSSSTGSKGCTGTERISRVYSLVGVCAFCALVVHPENTRDAERNGVDRGNTRCHAPATQRSPKSGNVKERCYSTVAKFGVATPSQRPCGSFATPLRLLCTTGNIGREESLLVEESLIKKISQTSVN